MASFSSLRVARAALVSGIAATALTGCMSAGSAPQLPSATFVQNRGGPGEHPGAGADDRHARGGPAARVWLAIVDRPPRQPRSGQTPSGVKVGGHQASVGVDGERSMTRAVVRAMLRGAGPRVASSRTPRRCCTRSTTCSGGSTSRYLTHAARVRRPAVATRAGPRTPTRSTIRPARWASARPRRSGARSPTATSRGHFDVPPGRPPDRAARRRRARRGRVWEAIADPMVARLGEVLWVVDLNRQSLDRVVPDIAAGRLGRDVRGRRLADRRWSKYGPRLRLFERDGGDALRRGSTRCPTRSTSACCAPSRRSCASASRGRGQSDVAKLLPSSATTSCSRPLRDLGGHDLGVAARRLSPRRTPSPTAHRSIFAYTIKGVVACRPRATPPNHSALPQPRRSREELASKLGGRTPTDPWALRSPAGLAGGRLLASARQRGSARERAPSAGAAGPADVGRKHTAERPRPSRRSGASSSTSAHEAPDGGRAGRHASAPTSAPRPTSAAGSTSAGIWNLGERIDWFADDTDTLVALARAPSTAATLSWGSPRCNLVGLLGELGATWSRDGQPLLPDRHDLRPVRGARAGAVVVRHLRGRPVDPRRHAVRAIRN